MTRLADFPLDDGGIVQIEIDEPLDGMDRAGRVGTVVREAGESFERALAGVRDAASAALGQFRSMAERPDEVEIKFGVKMDAQAGAVIAKTGLQGQFEVKLKWIRTESEDPSPEEETPAR
ncbi:CU044_2847 family protein [Amycolatopsis sp. cg5]|uniref:CU044_2847 family protein n=1 Tax=Amycolatopsis sp. cg5 TaxID=3238802 RepID=UPI00352680B1